MPHLMAGARTFIATIGVIIALAGVAVAAYVERILGMAMVAIGGFLLSLAVTRVHD